MRVCVWVCERPLCLDCLLKIRGKNETHGVGVCVCLCEGMSDAELKKRRLS